MTKADSVLRTMLDGVRGRRYDCLSMGGLCFEEAVRLDSWPLPGHRRTSIRGRRTVAGGSAPNVAVFAARAGGNAAFYGKTGGDEEGARLLEALRAEGVDVSHCRSVPGVATTYQIVMTVGDDWSVLLQADPVLDIGAEDIPAAAIGEARILHLDGFGMFTSSQKAVTERALSVCRESGTLVSIDAGTQMAVEQPEYLRTVMSRADVAFANLAEARAITGREHEAEIIEALRPLGPPLVLLKLGSRGAVAITADAEYRTPAFAVRVVDAVGAGDALVAGTLMGLCSGEPIADALRRGAAVAALACTGPGSLGSRFGEEEIEQLMNGERENG